MNKIAVLGAGSWGTALSLLLAENGHDVLLWVHREEHRKEIEQSKENSLYLPGFSLPSNITLTSEITDAVSEDIILCVLPSHAVRSTLLNLPSFSSEKLWIFATKGIENDTLLTVSEVACSFSNTGGAELAVLSGPSFAVEVAEKKPTAVVAASRDIDVAKKVQKIFSSSAFRVYTHTDVTGVEIGGTVKNVIAIAAGICDGLELGMNARAALITRGLHEIMRLGKAMGAKESTFSGLSGLGDLVLTCTGSLSRNRRVGFEIGCGKTLDLILGSTSMVAEGVKNAVSVYKLAQKHGVDMPITKSVYEILFCGKPPAKAVESLMGRILKEEMYSC